MDGNTIVSIIGGLIILGLVVLAIFIRMKKNPSIYDKQAATEFLEGLSNIFYQKMMDIVGNIKFDKYSSIEEMEADVLHDIYDTIWEYVSEELEEAAQKDILTALALKVLNKDFVDKFIDRMLENCDIESKLDNLWKTNKIESSADQIVEEDKKIASEFSDSKQYNENFDVKNLAKSEDDDNDDDSSENLNPQKDITEDELSYNADEDESVEVVEDNTYIDANGRKRDRKTGRYV